MPTVLNIRVYCLSQPWLTFTVVQNLNPMTPMLDDKFDVPSMTMRISEHFSGQIAKTSRTLTCLRQSPISLPIETPFSLTGWEEPEQQELYNGPPDGYKPCHRVHWPRSQSRLLLCKPSIREGEMSKHLYRSDALAILHVHAMIYKKTYWLLKKKLFETKKKLSLSVCNKIKFITVVCFPGEVAVSQYTGHQTAEHLKSQRAE